KLLKEKVPSLGDSGLPRAWTRKGKRLGFSRAFSFQPEMRRIGESFPSQEQPFTSTFLILINMEFAIP
ncbi:MAG TPA: hypothetical protein VJ873_02340, partial [bacterium]|nr:hypothetical protein [bacterium]